MIPQQVQNVLRHLKEVHGIEKHLVMEALLPKGTPLFPGREYMSCSEHVSLGMCELMMVQCESLEECRYKSSLCTQAS